MANRLQFSVITPVLNGERTIRRTLASVAGQTGATWEHIVVDNGSDDGTAGIVAEMGGDRVRYHRIEQRNRSLARNTGIDLARGEYLLFLDADDWLTSGALACHARVFGDDPSCGISVTDGWFCSDQGERIVRFSERRPLRHGEAPLASLVESSGTIGAPVCAAVRAETVRDAGLRFPEDLFIGEDWLFFVFLAARTTMRFSDDETCMYRWHEANTTLGSSLGERQRQLSEVRRRIAAAPWFAELPVPSRRHFFYESLFAELSGCPERQREVIDSASFVSLPPGDQAVLLRLAAGDAVRAGLPESEARRLLLSSLRLQSFEWKTWTLLALSYFPLLAKAVVRGRPAPQPSFPEKDLPAVRFRSAARSA
jgi:glycosyltransferase involved in cell wall biosynthesis